MDSFLVALETYNLQWTQVQNTFFGEWFLMAASAFSVDTYKKEKKIDISPIRSKFIKQAVTFSNIQTCCCRNF